MRKFIIAAALASVVGACSKGDQSARGNTVADSAGGSVASATTAAPANNIPKAVVDIGTYGEDLYDQVKASKWTKAKALMDSLDASATTLSADERANLTGTLDTLRNAIAAKRREAALEGSNRVTYVVAIISEPYKPVTPVAIVLLDYYGRELEIWSGRGNMAKLKSTSADLTKTWDGVKPTVVSAGGATAAATTDSLVAKLGVAKSPADYARLATPFLNVVDELEKPFAK
jgi:hypothetical protein